MPLQSLQIFFFNPCSLYYVAWATIFSYDDFLVQRRDFGLLIVAMIHWIEFLRHIRIWVLILSMPIIYDENLGKAVSHFGPASSFILETSCLKNLYHHGL